MLMKIRSILRCTTTTPLRNAHNRTTQQLRDVQNRTNKTATFFYYTLLAVFFYFQFRSGEKSIIIPMNNNHDNFDDGDDPIGVDRKEDQQTTPIRILQNWNDTLPPKQDDSIVRCVVLSDTHGLHKDLPTPLPEGDVLIHLGDVANRGSLSDIRSFVSYLKEQQQQQHWFQDIVLLEGNHDRDMKLPDRLNLIREYAGVGHFLQDEMVMVANGKLSILGVSWNACESGDYSSSFQVAAKTAAPVDMFLTHYASKHLTKIVEEEYQFPVHLFGHVHRQRGVQLCSDDGRVAINCASIPAMRPCVIDWDPKLKQVVLVHVPTPHK